MSEAIVRGSHPIHWARPDIAGDVVAVARDPSAAPPRQLRLRPELLERMLAQLDPDTRADVQARAEVAGIPFVVDPQLPAFPGFEVVRARPEPAGRPEPAAPPEPAPRPHVAAA